MIGQSRLTVWHYFLVCFPHSTTDNLPSGTSALHFRQLNSNRDSMRVVGSRRSSSSVVFSDIVRKATSNNYFFGLEVSCLHFLVVWFCTCFPNFPKSCRYVSSQGIRVSVCMCACLYEHTCMQLHNNCFHNQIPQLGKLISHCAEDTSRLERWGNILPGHFWKWDLGFHNMRVRYTHMFTLTFLIRHYSLTDALFVLNPGIPNQRIPRRCLANQRGAAEQLNDEDLLWLTSSFTIVATDRCHLPGWT